MQNNHEKELYALKKIIDYLLYSTNFLNKLKMKDNLYHKLLKPSHHHRQGWHLKVQQKYHLNFITNKIKLIVVKLTSIWFCPLIVTPARLSFEIYSIHRIDSPVEYCVISLIRSLIEKILSLPPSLDTKI